MTVILKNRIYDVSGTNGAEVTASGELKVIATPNGTQPVSVTTLPLPTGASTLAEQVTQTNTLDVINTSINTLLTDTQLRASAVPVSLTSTTISNFPNTQAVSGTVTANLGTIAGVATETTLSALNTKVPANLTVTATRLLTDSSGVTQPISATALPLPTGASTFALQTAGNTSLSSIDTKLPSGLTVKAASTAPLATDQALVVTISPNSPAIAGGATSANQTTLGSQTTKINDGTNTQAVKAASTVPVAADPASVVTLSPNISTVATSIAKAEDAAHTSGDVGVMMLGVRSDANVIKTSADGDYSVITTDLYGSQRMVGDIAHSSSDNLNTAPVKVAGVCMDSTYPTATNFNAVTRLATDNLGRLVTSHEAPRATRVFGQATLTTTTETTIINGSGGSFYTDVSAIIVSNLGAGAENITFRFGAGGTIFAVVASLANTSQTMSFPVSIPATAVNLSITATMNAAAATGVSVTVVGIRNK